ncbi:DUF1097 domain-containing protein [Pseudonocardia oroxyli]|uniref:DUF1097 domain-containing protein n=1 Tax=Pseudonocardia oroxyli TaxID=366584 RepID=A0A1G7LLS1_PSEOR|nr:DUF1097 domain-containing protein [Pseudonocardia oroxyli]SDF50326.1 Protein of unknown function [Pseudonocardia oroxyli]
MKLPVALALVIGVIGAVITYLYVGPLGGLGLMVPATFVGAASYFAAGGDRAALAKSVPANVWGIVCGTVTLILIGLATSPIVIGLIVGGLTAVFILGALVPALGFVPGSVFGYATTVMFGLLTGASGTDLTLPTGPFTVMLVSFLVGAAFGYVSSVLAGKLVAKPEAVPAA